MSKCSSASKTSRVLTQGELFPQLATAHREIPNGSVAGNESIIRKLRKATKPIMVQIAPGQWTPVAGEKAPDMSIVYWSQNTDGSYFPSPVTSRFVRVTGKLVKHLGFDGKYNTLYRLGRGGFIEMIKIAPNTMLLNLDSFYNHLRRCAEDPFYWEKDGKAIQEYRRSI